MKRTCIADDMCALAEAAGLDPTVHKRKHVVRSLLYAELDAACFRHYGLARDDAEFIPATFPAATQANDEAPLYADGGGVWYLERGEGVRNEVISLFRSLSNVTSPRAAHSAVNR